MKFRKKPVVIDAEQFNGSHESVAKIMALNGISHIDRHFDDELKIFTLEGIMTANIGDWIIKGIAREFYPCKPDIFEKTYEKVGGQHEE